LYKKDLALVGGSCSSLLAAMGERLADRQDGYAR
jgi:hypothetical protein